MDFSAVCRTCLKEGDLNPIFSKSDDEIVYSDVIFATTGIKVAPNDGLPQNMCTDCKEFINKSLKFRETCHEVEKHLLSLKNQLESTESITQDFADNEISYEQDNTKIFVKIVPLSMKECKINDISQIKMEYTDYEVLEDIDGLSDTNVEDDLFLKNTPNSTTYKTDFVTQSLLDPPYLPILDKSEHKTKRVSCKLCQKELSIRSVDAHMSSHHPGADLRKEKCELCDNYITKGKMKRHTKMVHGNGKVMRCGYCKSEFDCKDLLIRHVASCTAKKKQRIYDTSKTLSECDICHKTMQRRSLRLHKAVKHAGLGPVCEHCGRRFSNKLRLSEHYKAKHGYDKFKCDQCDFECATYTALQNHGRRHRGEKPFVCSRCGASFHAAYLLTRHRQSHATDRTIQCALCPAKFKAPNSLHMHKLTCHSGVIYKCPHCPKTYGSKQYTIKHIRHIHKYTGPIPDLQKVDAEPMKNVKKKDSED